MTLISTILATPSISLSIRGRGGIIDLAGEKLKQLQGRVFHAVVDNNRILQYRWVTFERHNFFDFKKPGTNEPIWSTNSILWFSVPLKLQLCVSVIVWYDGILCHEISWCFCFNEYTLLLHSYHPISWMHKVQLWADWVSSNALFWKYEPIF